VTPAKSMLISATLLAAFAVGGTAIVALTFTQTAERVSQNKRDYTLGKLHELIKPDQHTNDMDRDTIEVQDLLLGTKEKVLVYRARKNGEPVAAIIQSVAPDGYSGRIEMLVAIKYSGELAGVRVVEHRETPGLGDAIDARKSDWIEKFGGKSLQNTDETAWKVSRDGGKFDQITSATITSRAVVKCIYNTLKYYDLNRDYLFRQQNDE
jgi:electron transport complex protein RnfG